jgi:putative membrane protein
MWNNSQTAALAGEPSSWGWMHHPGWEWMMGMHGFVWLVLAALAVVALVAVIRSTRGSSRATGDPAIAVLATRYARGEIDRGEYLERRRDLS